MNNVFVPVILIDIKMDQLGKLSHILSNQVRLPAFLAGWCEVCCFAVGHYAANAPEIFSCHAQALCRPRAYMVALNSTYSLTAGTEVVTVQW